MEQPRLACEIYDHLELACVRRQLLRVKLLTGETVTGRATDVGTKQFAADPETHTAASRGEYIVLALPQDEPVQAIPPVRNRELRLVELAWIEALGSKASFQRIILQPPPAITQY